jgi:PilZ domain-containing protein
LSRESRRDLRKVKRTPRRQAAWVVLDGGAQVACVLWDISDAGARIAAARAGALPDIFALFLSKDGKARRFCRVAWRRGGQLGVQFVEEAAANIDLAPRPAWMRRASPAPLVAAAPSKDAAPAADIDTSQILLPGCGPQLALEAARAFRWSSLARGMLYLLIGATAVFALANLLDDAEWAQSVCSSAENFCRHPEWTGAAAVAMTAIYLAVSGMED